MNLERQLVPIRGLPAFDADEVYWNMAEVWRREYVTIKYSLAKAIQPKRICEIGVYSGIAALSFLEACPDAEYIGIDNLYSEIAQGVSIVSKTKEVMDTLGYSNKIVVVDSQTLAELPEGPFDLVHVDACHTRAATEHDVILAWQGLAPSGYIVIDNGHDSNVCAGTFDAMYRVLNGRLFKWNYFEDSVGNILISRELL